MMPKKDCVILTYDPDITEKLKNIFSHVDKVYRAYTFYPDHHDDIKTEDDLKNLLDVCSDYEFLGEDGITIGSTEYIIQRTDGKILKISASEDVWFTFSNGTEFVHEENFLNK